MQNHSFDNAVKGKQMAPERCAAFKSILPKKSRNSSWSVRNIKMLETKLGHTNQC